MSQDTPENPETPEATGSTPRPGASSTPRPGASRYPNDHDLDLQDPYEGADDRDVVEIEADHRGSSLPVRLGAEAFGAFALVLVALGVPLYTSLTGAGTLGTALAVALVYVGGAIALGHVSGAHFNPAVTLGAAVAGRTAWQAVLPYWVAQVIGATLAGAVLLLTIPKALPALVTQVQDAATTDFFALTANGFDALSPLAVLTQGSAEFGLVAALLIEVLATAVLVGVALASTGRGSRRLAPIAIGLTYGALVLIAAPITGAGLNPARSTAAAIFSGGDVLGQLWLFWVAPLVGALLAGLVAMALAPHAPVQDNLLGDSADDVEIEIDRTTPTA